MVSRVKKEKNKLKKNILLPAELCAVLGTALVCLTVIAGCGNNVITEAKTVESSGTTVVLENTTDDLEDNQNLTIETESTTSNEDIQETTTKFVPLKPIEYKTLASNDDSGKIGVEFEPYYDANAHIKGEASTKPVKVDFTIPSSENFEGMQGPKDKNAEQVTEASKEIETQKPTEAFVKLEPTEPQTSVNPLDNRINDYMSTYNGYINEVLKRLNEQRTANGVNVPLALDDTLCKVATYRCIECVDYQLFSHTRPDGSTFDMILDDYRVSYSIAGENLARGQNTPESVVTAWMNSEGHRANILYDEFTSVGIGVMQNPANNKYYWALIFIG